jgi:hypothetical protein
MSLTQSRGLTNAGRWTAVAATLADHLEALEAVKQRGGEVPPPPPKGAIEAARRFFQFVLAGIDLDQRRSDPNAVTAPRPYQATAAGISNLSIAVKVIKSENRNEPVADLTGVEREIKALLDSLVRMQSSASPPTEAELKSLAWFLRELQRQGEIEQDASIAFQEGPKIYRNAAPFV